MDVPRQDIAVGGTVRVVSKHKRAFNQRPLVPYRKIVPLSGGFATIVISGDTAPTQALIDHSRGCDVLIHEAYSTMACRNSARPSPEFRRRHHTSSAELAAIANKVKPGTLVTYHRSTIGEESSSPDRDVLIEEITRDYSGRVVAANDLDIF